jgi:hypothetical protein
LQIWGGVINNLGKDLLEGFILRRPWAKWFLGLHKSWPKKLKVWYRWPKEDANYDDHKVWMRRWDKVSKVSSSKTCLSFFLCWTIGNLFGGNIYEGSSGGGRGTKSFFRTKSFACCVLDLDLTNPMITLSFVIFFFILQL